VVISRLESGEDRLSEVDVTAGRGAPPERRRGRLWRLALAAAFVLAAVIGGVLVVHANALHARFLMVAADSIPGDAELMRFAMSRGASAYAQHCASCHGAHLKGDPSLAVPNLADHDWLYGLGRVSEIERVILYGIRSGNSKGWDLAHMPAFATSRPYDLYAMAPLSPGDASRKRIRRRSSGANRFSTTRIKGFATTVMVPTPRAIRRSGLPI
jgi:mono/diheme cytochrome c family protein